ILTSLAIAVGAFTIAVSLAAGEGARQYANNLINSNVNPQSLFIVADDALFGGGGMGQSPIRVYEENTSSAQGVTMKMLTQEDIDAISARDVIESIVPIFSIQADYMT